MNNGKAIFLNPCDQCYLAISQTERSTNVAMPKNPPAKASEQPQRATHPPDERPHSIVTPNPDDTARWLHWLILPLSVVRLDVAETEVLARKEQTAIKRRI